MEIECSLKKADFPLEEYFQNRKINNLSNVEKNTEILLNLLFYSVDLVPEFLSLAKVDIKTSLRFQRSELAYLISTIKKWETMKKLISLGANPTKIDMEVVLYHWHIFGNMVEYFLQLDIISHSDWEIFKNTKITNHDSNIKLGMKYGYKEYLIENINYSYDITFLKLPFDVISNIENFIILK